MDFARLIAAAEAQLRAAQATRAGYVTEQTALLEALPNERASLSETDQARFDELRSLKAAATGSIDQLSAKLEELRREQGDDERMTRAAEQRTPGAEPISPAVITNEARTYTSETAMGGRSFFADAFRSEKRGDSNARARLERHAREVEVHKEISQRAAETGGFAGLIVPQYLIQWAAPKLRAGRGVANVVTRLPLPAEGMNLVITKGTTGASVDVQQTENSDVSNTDEEWTDLTIPVRTIAGQQDVSRQVLERGTGNDQLIYLDLARAYGARLGTQVINGSGSAGQVKGILNTAGIGAATAFGAPVSSANLTKKIAGANASVYGAGEGIAPDVLVMAPRRWGWLSGEVDGQGRPLVTVNTVANVNAVAVGSATGEAFADAPVRYAGTHSSGLPVLIDNNIPTAVGTNSEDVILSLDSDELLLWEEGDGLPRQLMFEQTAGGSLTTKLVVYGYVAFTAERYPEAAAKIGGLDTVAGDGLIQPTF